VQECSVMVYGWFHLHCNRNT